MAKQTKKAEAKTPVTKERKDPRIECTYEEVVEFMCPVRGLVKQKVKIKRYKPLSEGSDKHVLAPGSFVDAIEKQDDGLSIYKDGDPEVEKE